MAEVAILKDGRLFGYLAFKLFIGIVCYGSCLRVPESWN